jgi:hypothetical protein
MIIAHGTSGGRMLLVLGLSKSNVERLLNKQPMVLNPKTHPGIPHGWEIVIAYGETEAALQKEMEPGIGPHTLIIADPRL